MLIKKGYAPFSRGQVHFRLTPQRSGLPLVLLHQTASASAMFEPLMAELAGDFSLFAPDTPGFGQSTALENPSVPAFTAAIFEALSANGIRRCRLYGHHTGAAIAVQLAYDHPGLVEKMVLSGPPLLSEAVKQKLAASLTSPKLAPDGSHWQRTWDRIQGRFPEAPLELVHRETLLSVLAGDNYPAAYAAVFQQDIADQLAALRMPILVMAGERDTLRASLEPAFECLQHGSMQVVPGAGTYINDTHTAEVARILKKFFS